ncbi:hypothetical protein ACHHYP_00791 [Achlya hypogyna]|uniref:F-box domain-containing protein n=1 Tax=Achlya hypogyna TaxID=1202772 RepID=A0A1V9ZAE1_ACHHY|nr:hypothetical protein ACHHYP_00791 [Achlya hypogyna]
MVSKRHGHAVWESNELLCEVLSWLGIRDLGCACRVSLRWYLLGSNSVLWTTLAKRALAGAETTTLFDLLGPKPYLKLHARRLRTKHLARCIWGTFVESNAWPQLCAHDKWLARLHIAAGLDALAATKYTHEASLESADIVSLLSAYADLLEEQFHDADGAAALLQRAIPLSATPAYLMHNLALLEDKQDRLDSAESWFAKAYGTDPTYQRALCNYAVFLDERRQRYDAAAAMYEAALRNDPHDLDTVGAFADFLTFKRPDLDRVHDLFRQAMRGISARAAPRQDGSDLKIIIQYAEFLTYVCSHPEASAVYQTLLGRLQCGRNSTDADAGLFLCVGLLSYAIAAVYANEDHALGRRLVVEATTIGAYHTSDRPVLQRYKLTAACTVLHVLTPLPALCNAAEREAVGPLNGLLLYLQGDEAAAATLWASCVGDLADVNRREYAFAGYCLGVLFHLRGGPAQRPLALQVMAKAIANDLHGVEYRNLAFVLRECVAVAPGRAHDVLDVLTQYYLAHQARGS